MVFLVLASFLYGLSYPLASIMIGSVDALEFSFHFLLILTLIQLPFVLRKWKEIKQMTFRKEFGLLLMAGLIGSFLYWCEFSSLNVGLPVVHLTFLSLTVPAWTLLYEWLRGRGTEWNLNKWVIALIGSAILINPNERGEFSIGLLLPIFTSLLMALWLIYSKKCQETGISPIVCSFFNDFFSLLGIGLFILIKGRAETLSVPAGIGSIALYAIAIGLLPNLLFLYGLRSANVVSAATIIMLEPVFTGLTAILVSNEAVTLNLLTGAVFISASCLPDNVLAYVRRVTVAYGLNTFK